MELCLRMAWWLAFVVRWLMVGFWCAAAALCVLTAAGRLAARLPVFAVHPHLTNTHVCQPNTPWRASRSPTWTLGTCVTHLLLCSPVLAVGEAAVLALGFLFCLDDAVFLKLHQTAVWIPRLSAESRRLLVTGTLPNL